MKEQPDRSKPEPPLGTGDQYTDHELADQTVERGFRLLTLSALIFVVAALTFLLSRDELITLRSEEPNGSLIKDAVERQVAQLSKSPRLSSDVGLRVRPLASATGVVDTQVDRHLSRHSGGMALVRVKWQRNF